MPAGAPPFLSVVVRAHSERPWLLHDTLLALAAQTYGDLEVFLMADADHAGGAVLEELAGDFAEDFRARVDLTGGRMQAVGRLVDIATARTHGRYLAVLDEGEVPLGQWAAELRRAAAAEPGQAIHGAIAEQRVALEDWPKGHGYASVSPVSVPEEARFDLIDHLDHLATFTGSGGVAVPRELVASLSPPEDGPRWDAWAVLLRAALSDGVTSTGAVIVLRRSWNEVGGPGEPDAARRAALLARLDAERVTVPPGSLQRLQRLAAERRDRRARVGELEREQGKAAVAARQREEQLRRDRAAAARVAAAAAQAAEELRRSTSWRLTRPVRAAGALVRRLGRRTAR
jgi:hypothetical protein